MTTSSELQSAAERLMLYHETLGGSCSPYRVQDEYTFDGDAVMLADHVLDDLYRHYPHGYMDKVDYEEELGNADGGNLVCPSVEDLCARRRCAKEYCGVVEVEVRLVRVVIEPTNEEDKSCQ